MILHLLRQIVLINNRQKILIFLNVIVDLIRNVQENKSLVLVGVYLIKNKQQKIKLILLHIGQILDIFMGMIKNLLILQDYLKIERFIEDTDKLPPKDQKGNFITDDIRANQNPALIIYQIIFRREHNRICDQILKRNSKLSGEQVYHAARNYVTGLYQHIVYDQFLPILLDKQNYQNLIGSYKYQQSIDPSLLKQFSTAAFRIGHSLVTAPFLLIDNNGNLIKKFQAGEMFFNPKLINKQNVDLFLNGFIRTKLKQRNLQMVDDLRNFLFAPDRKIKIELFTFNVQIGRDHGICTLNDAREKVGLSKKDNFYEPFADNKKANALEKLYQKTDNIDLWLGILGQPSFPGAVLGQLGIRLNALQFKNLRNADRFWHENIFSQNIIKQIKATTLSDIIRRNTGVKTIGRQAFSRF